MLLDKLNKKIPISYLIIILLVFSFLIFNLFKTSNLNAPGIFDSDYGNQLKINFDIYKDELLIDSSALPYSFKSSTKNKNIELIGTLPKDDSIDNTFISFRASGYSVIIEIDNEEIYNYYLEGANDYGGGYWHFALIPENSSNKEIKIKLFCPSDNPFSQNIYPIYNGSKGYLLNEDFGLKYLSLFIGLMLISFGFIFLGIIVFLNKTFNNSILLSLSLLLICFGIWIFTQSGSKQIIGITNPAMPMIFSFFSMVSLPLFLWYYLKTNFKSFENYKILKKFAYFILLLYIPISIANIYGIIYTKFLSIIGFLILSYSILLLAISIKIYKIEKKNIISCIIALIGIFSSIIIEEILLLLKISIKAIPIVHIGIAFAAIIFIYKTINNLIEKNIEDNESKLLKNMAYIDIVTLTKNRNSYEKFLKENGDIIDNVGIILSDVNGLKIINDKYGHKYGDALLKNLSKSLKDFLFEDSLVFRIGGDEFVAIIKSFSKKEFDSFVKDLIEKFYPNQYNYGMAIGGHFFIRKEDQYIEKAIEKADKQMYQNKEKQKQLLNEDFILTKKYFGEIIDYNNIIKESETI